MDQVVLDPDETGTMTPTDDHDDGRRLPVSSRQVMFGVAAASVVGVFVSTLRYGIGLTPDSATYVTGARSLATGAGYTSNGHAITDFPPGYSWVLSLGEHLGLHAIDGARVLSVIAIVATVVLGYQLVCRHVVSEGVRIATTVSIGCSAVVLEIYEKALSEHLFLPVLLIFVLVAEDILRRERRARLCVAMVALAWAGFYLRYAGVVLVVVGALVVVLAYRSRGMASALARAAGFGVAAGSLPLVWMIRNVDAGSGPLGPRAGASASIFTNVSRVLNEMSTWVATDAAPSLLRRAVLVIVLLAVVVGLLALASSDRRLDRPTVTIVPLFALVSIYVVYLIGSASVVAFAAINTRLLVPVFIPLVVLTAWLYEELRPVVTRPGVSRAITGVAIAWVVLSVVWFAARAENSAQNGAGGYAIPRWHNSKIMGDVRKIDFSIPTYSNDAPAIGLFTGLHARASIEKTHFQSDEQTPGALKDFVRLVQCRGKVQLVWFKPNPRPYMYDPIELSTKLRLRVLVSRSDGVIYDVSPLRPDPSACTAASS